MSNQFVQPVLQDALDSHSADRSGSARSRLIEGAGVHPNKGHSPHVDKAALESRSRMISFRVTVEEFERFRKLCVERGLQNVSQVVRLAVNQLFDDSSFSVSGDSLASRVARLESRLDDMARSVAAVELRLHEGGQEMSQMANTGGA